MTSRVFSLSLAAFTFSAAAFAQPVTQAVFTGCFPGNPALAAGTYATGSQCDSAFQVRYFANLVAGDSFIDATNDGSVITEAMVGAGVYNFSTGDICVNVYTFNAGENMVSCCACKITPNGLVSLSAQQDLISNTLTLGAPTSITVKLLATTPIIQGTFPLTASESCNPAFPFGLNANPAANEQQNIAPSLHAWATTIHAQPNGGAYGATETEFKKAALGITGANAQFVKTSDEIDRLALFCGFIQSNGSGFGICKSCRTGGLGAVQQ